MLKTSKKKKMYKPDFCTSKYLDYYITRERKGEKDLNA